MKNQVIRLIGQLYQVTTRKDGGSRVVIDVGYESIGGIQELQRMNGAGDTNLAIAIATYEESSAEPFQDFKL